MRAMTKSQLAKKAGVSMRTMRRWLADPYMKAQMASMRLKKQQQLLPPRAVQLICEHYAIEID